MKTNIITLFILFTSLVSARGQELLDIIKRDLNVERRTLVSEAMQLAPGTETEFWQVYNVMESELDGLTDKRAGNINKFADHYTNVTDDIANDLAMVYFDIIGNRNKIYKTYYKKMSKIISKKQAARFIQVMAQIQLLIEVQIAMEVPLIE